MWCAGKRVQKGFREVLQNSMAGSKRKRALHSAMTQLETEVEQGHVNEGAHVRLSQCLKTAHDATPDGKTRHVRAYLIDALVDNPFAAINVPLQHRWLIENQAFLRRLIQAKRKEEVPIKDDWWADLMEGLLPEWMVEKSDDQSLRSICRATVITLLRVRWHTLSPLEAHLNKLKVVPSELFPLDPPEDTTDYYATVWDAVEDDARFVRWLLKGKDKGGYSPAQRARLREYAFDHADAMARKDPEWLKALGLRNIMEYMGCELNRMLGKSFVDARAMAR